MRPHVSKLERDKLSSPTLVLIVLFAVQCFVPTKGEFNSDSSVGIFICVGRLD